MEAKNSMSINDSIKINSNKLQLKADDKLALGHIKYAQGLGASLRYANELRAVQQTGRLPFLKSSNLHEDVLKGNLGPGTGLKNIFDDQEEVGRSRLAYL